MSTPMNPLPTKGPVIIRTVAAVILNPQQQVLLVRKRGSAYFIQPGGKPEPGEDALATLIRELREELNVEVVPDSLEPLGEFEDWAVNEHGSRVRAQAYRVVIQGEPIARAEIAEIRWFSAQEVNLDCVAPLSALGILAQVWADRLNTQ